MMKKWKNEDIWLAPPQVYELSRLLNIKKYEELKKFTTKREKFGVERFLPVRLIANDGWISLLPGMFCNPFLSFVLALLFS